MTYTIIPAAPGFTARWVAPDGGVASEPIIAWRISEDGAHVVPIGVEGWVDDGAWVVDPSGVAPPAGGRPCGAARDPE